MIYRSIKLCVIFITITIISSIIILPVGSSYSAGNMSTDLPISSTTPFVITIPHITLDYISNEDLESRITEAEIKVESIIESPGATEEIVVSEEQEPIIINDYSVPNIDSNFKAYMSYKCIADKRSPQYQLQCEAYTDENGLRKVGDYYCVALGTYYTSIVGEKFEITLSSGNTFLAIIGDVKADKDTNATCQYSKGNVVVEFIVDTSAMTKYIKASGNISTITGFEGTITEIKKIIE